MYLRFELETIKVERLSSASPSIYNHPNVYSLLRSMREISAMVRSNAHDTIVEEKITTPAHTAHSIGASMPKSTTIGAIRAPNVANNPKISVMSAAFTITASRRIYFDLGLGPALV